MQGVVMNKLINCLMCVCIISSLSGLAIADTSIDKTIVYLVQKELTQRGFDPGPIDGLLGSKTVAAIRDFQSSRKLSPTGKISDSLLKELGISKERDNTRTGNGEESEIEIWTIGNIKLESTSDNNQPLEVRSAGRSSLNSYNFVGKVGGVSFEQIAIPDSKIATQAIKLAYSSDAQDGSRVLVRIGSKILKINISDWLLILRHACLPGPCRGHESNSRVPRVY